MRYLYVLSFLFLFLSSTVYADKVKSALKYLEEGDFAKAKSTLDKDLQKDPNNAGASYVYSLYFLTKGNKAYNADSSYFYILKAHTNYPNTEGKTKEDWLTVNISDKTILTQKEKLESMAYGTAVKQNTLESYQLFINKFSTAKQIPEITKIRDEIAWKNATTKNSIEIYKSFMDKYPQATQYNEAKNRYERLVYDKETQSGTLNGYIDFIRKYPDNQFVADAERTVYDIETINHSIQAYDGFVKKYPQSPHFQKAMDWLAVLYYEQSNLETFLNQYPDYSKKEYILELASVEKKQFVAIYENKKYAYIDETGKVCIPAKYLNIPIDNLCESILSYYIIVNEENLVGVIDKLGNQLIKSDYDEVKVFDPGIFKVHRDGKDGLFHSLGFEICHPIYEQIEILNSKYIKVKKDTLWGLISYNGRKVTECVFDDISIQGKGFVQLKKDKKFNLVGNELLANWMIQPKNQIKTPYQHIVLINDEYAKVKPDSLTGIIDTKNNIIIPISYKDVKLVSDCWAAKTKNTWKLFDKNGKSISNLDFKNFVSNKDFIAAKADKFWGILDNKGNVVKDFSLDSVAFIGNIVLYFKDKKINAEFPDKKELIDLTAYTNLEIEQGGYKNAPSYLKFTKTGKTGLLSMKGETVLQPLYEEIHILDDSLISVKQAGKYGLVNFKGKVIIAPKYEGISNLENGYKGLLLNRSFGIYHQKRKTLIEPNYDVLLTPYHKSDSNKIFIANQEGYYGIIHQNNKILLPLNYLKIEQWTDSVAISQREDETWIFSTFLKKPEVKEVKKEDKTKTQQNKTIVKDTVKVVVKKELFFNDVIFIKKNDTEKLMIGKQNGLMGLWSNKKGIILPLEYDLIYNLGTKEEPIFFVQKKDKKTDTYQVSYINDEGKIIWNRVMKEFDYRRIVCE